MRTLKLIIDDAELEKQLEGFEDEVVYRQPRDCDAYITDMGNVFINYPRDSKRIILTPKPKPLPEPDWSKLGMLKSGTWVCWDSVHGWKAYCSQPELSVYPRWCESSCSGCIKLLEYGFNLSAFPSVPADRWREACWQVP